MLNFKTLSMRLLSTTIILLILSATSLLAQSKYYFNDQWLSSGNTEASYFSIVKQLPDSRAVVSDYKIDHTLLSETEYKILKANPDWSKLYEEGFQEFAVESGKCTQYHENGKKKKQFYLINGIQKGEIREWDENEKLARIYYADHQLANGEYIEYFATGDVNFEVIFKKDTLNGNATYYYPNGQMSQKGNFRKGVKLGKWDYWDEEGNTLGSEIYRQMFYIEGPKIKILFPEGVWCLSDQYKEEDRVNFLFSRAGSNEGVLTDFVPTCLLTMETVAPNTNLVDYSSFRRRRLSVDVHKVITKDQDLFSIPNSMGYLASYYDENKNKHAAIVLHTVQNNVGVELVIDTRQEDYNALKKEIVKILRSIRK